MTEATPLVGSYLSSDPYVWVAAFFTLAIYSFLYKDNVIYKITESIFIGVAAGLPTCASAPFSGTSVWP